MIGIEVKDTSGISKKLKKLYSFEVDERFFKALKRGGRVVRNEAKARAIIGTREPYQGAGTGRLKKSIRVKTYAKKLFVRVQAWYPKNPRVWKKSGRKEYYAFAVEYGTRHQSKKPFLHPALEAKKDEVEKIIIKEFEDLVSEI